MSSSELIFKACETVLPHFRNLVCDYEERGILNSEMLAVCSVCEELGVEVLIESGRARGQSTLTLAKYFLGRDFRLISIEYSRDHDAYFAERRLGAYEDVELLYGDSRILIPKLVKDFKEKRIAVLLDGPKGPLAVELFRAVLATSDNVLAGFFHDTYKGSRTRPFLCEHFQNVFFTDDKKYVEIYSVLDEICLPKKDQPITPNTWRPYMKGNNRIQSYGPTMGVVLPSKEEGSGVISALCHVIKWRVYGYLRRWKIARALYSLFIRN